MLKERFRLKTVAYTAGPDSGVAPCEYVHTRVADHERLLGLQSRMLQHRKNADRVRFFVLETLGAVGMRRAGQRATRAIDETEFIGEGGRSQNVLADGYPP